jgi:DNA-binding response OmpR family regulator
MISLGVYLFNRITGELKLNEQKTQLTGKESDLLQLLFENLNTTVERDVILSEVWGDEGDYVGRTLDVFISKLRKKLEEDNSVKIANVRGVGYKLVIG